MKHILVVEDDPDIQELLLNFLQEGGYTVTLAGDGVEAISCFHERSYDLVLLDIMLPKIDGYCVCELIRNECATVPIVMLTALDSEENQIKGFDLMIDDYITKPFSTQILLRKIAAVLRRSTTTKPQKNRLSYREIVLDLEAHRACLCDRPVELTLMEFELLKELIDHQGKVLTRQMLLTRLWGYDYFGGERVVDSHIKNLRKKIGNRYIETIRGVGYRIDQENSK